MMTVIYCDMRIIYLAEFTDFAEYSAGYFDDKDNDTVIMVMLIGHRWYAKCLFPYVYPAIQSTSGWVNYNDLTDLPHWE